MAGVFTTIPNNNKSFTPFKVYKSWTFNGIQDCISNGLKVFTALKPDPTKYSGNKVTLDSIEVFREDSSYLYNEADQQPAAVQWYFLKNRYYSPLINGKTNNTTKHFLCDVASVISIPTIKVGEGIKPLSVDITIENTETATGLVYLKDDGNGNLIDKDLPSPITNEYLYLGFNSMLNEVDISNIHFASPDTSLLERVKGNGVTYDRKNQDWNVSAIFSGSGYIQIPHTNYDVFRPAKEYSISFWYTHKTSSVNEQTLVSKRANQSTFYSVNQQTILQEQKKYINTYPFHIEVTNNVLSVSISNGIDSTELAYNETLVLNTTYHITVTKSLSDLKLYVNGTLISTAAVTFGNYQNEKDILIGCSGKNSDQTVDDALNGELKEFFIFSKEISLQEVQMLANSNSYMATNTNVVGKVAYKDGIVILSDIRPKYNSREYRLFNNYLQDARNGFVNQDNYLGEFVVNYNSTLTLYQNEFIIKISKDDYNFTSNPTIREDDDPNAQFPKSFVMDDAFSPYITTIGLYNQQYELVAVAKLASPVKKRNNVDLNIIVRFDY